MIAVILFEDDREAGNPDLGLVEHHLDLKLDHLPDEHMGGPLERRLGLATPPDPVLGFGAVVSSSRIEREVAVQGGRLDPALHQEGGMRGDDTSGPIHHRADVPTRLAQW